MSGEMKKITMIALVMSACSGGAGFTDSDVAPDTPMSDVTEAEMLAMCQATASRAQFDVEELKAVLCPIVGVLFSETEQECTRLEAECFGDVLPPVLELIECTEGRARGAIEKLPDCAGQVTAEELEQCAYARIQQVASNWQDEISCSWTRDDLRELPVACASIEESCLGLVRGELSPSWFLSF